MDQNKQNINSLGSTVGMPLQRAVERVRAGRRLKRDSDHALGEFLPAQFEKEHARPFRRLGQLIEIWSNRMPAQIVAQSRLASFTNGVLHVQVDSSATLYEADRLLRSGLEQAIRQDFRASALRKVRLSIDSSLQDTFQNPS